MRVVKYAQILGAAAGLFLLSGTAMADSSNASPSTGGAQHQKGDYAKPQAPGDQGDQAANSPENNSADNPTTNSTGTISETSNNSAVPVAQSSNGDSNGSGSNASSSSGPTSNDGANPSINANSSGSLNKASGASQPTGPGAVTNAAPMQIQKIDSSVDSSPVTTGSTTSASATIPVIQATYHPSADAEVVTTYHLALQPPIISYRYAAIPDFATSLPTHTPAPRAPAPPKTNGVLGELSVALDSVLVPQAYGPQQATLGWVVFTLMLLTLVLMPISLFRYNYGWWLRRGGLVTAPRSDAPISRYVTPSLIATPLYMGYVKAELRTHSPSLVV